eukprot:6598327-Prymnesium_polylepis.1
MVGHGGSASHAMRCAGARAIETWDIRGWVSAAVNSVVGAGARPFERSHRCLDQLYSPVDLATESTDQRATHNSSGVRPLEYCYETRARAKA